MKLPLVTRVLPFALGALPLSVASTPTDGFYWANAWWAIGYDFHCSTHYWENGVLPSDGGVGYYLRCAAVNPKFTQPVSLRGLDFGNVQFSNGRPTINGDGLTLTGDAFISGTGRGSNASGYDNFAAISGTVHGTGENSFTKRGVGILTVNQPLADFGTIVAGGGYLTTSASGGALYASGNPFFALRGGVFRWAPSLAQGASVTASLGPTMYGIGSSALVWGAGEGTQSALTLDSLTAEGPGATICIQPSGGSTALGASGRLMVTAPPASVNGMLDPGIVTRDTSVESWPFSFTAYDEEKGVIPFPVERLVPLSEATAADVAVLSETNTLETSRQVAALVVDNSALLSISNGVTLTVGDGDPAHAAGVIFNYQGRFSDNTPFVFRGEGTLDFGNAPGLIWTASPTCAGWGGNRRLEVLTKITGNAGVTFASRYRDERMSTGIVCLHNDGSAAWTGPTRVSGAILWIRDSSAALPPGDVYVLDGSGYGGQFRWDAAWTFPQNFFLSGIGTFGDEEGLVFMPQGKSVFNGTVTLVDDTAFVGASASACGLVFKKAVAGPGDFFAKTGGVYDFYEPNAFGSFIAENSTTVNLLAGGTFGTGRIWYRKGTHQINFTRPTSACVIGNDFRQEKGTSLSMTLDRATVTLQRNVCVLQANLSNFSSLALGGTLDVGVLAATGARDAAYGTEQVTAAGADGELSIGSDVPAVCGIPLADGAGRLAFTKKGSGTLELPQVARTYSGATTVKDGCLKFIDDPRESRSLLYWMDASRAEDFIKDETTGVITSWKSRGGSADVTFKTSVGTPTWGTADTVNGHAVVTTARESTADQLLADKSMEQRTVFIVYRLRSPVNMGGLFGGDPGSYPDFGVRLDGSAASSSWDANISHYCYNTTGFIRRDGARNGPADVNVPHILTVVHDRTGWAPSVSWGGNTLGCTFAPRLGWYLSATRNFDGDYCEILAFDRVLGESEMRMVENYLSEKWLDRTLWTDLQKQNHLPAETALTVETGATLDLAGNSVIVASLSGGGLITNSSTRAATLTVAGAATFSGEVSGNTCLAVKGDAVLEGTFSGDTAVSVSGGTARMGVEVLVPSTNGLAYWCDAARPETVLCDVSGNVTGWVSRASSSASALIGSGSLVSGGSTSARTRPTYAANALEGRPGLKFADAGAALWADCMTPVRTVFLVAVASGIQTRNCAGLWGLGNLDLGFRFITDQTSLEGGGGYVRPTDINDLVRMDGVSYDAAALPMGDGIPRVIAFRLAEHTGNNGHFRDLLGLDSANPTRTTVLGKYCGNPSFVGFVGEVIAYDRMLSDGEMRRVESYLMNKWKGAAWADGKPPAETAHAFAAGADISVGGGTRVDFGGADATVGTLSSAGGSSAAAFTHVGALTVTDRFLIAVANGMTVPITVDGDLVIGSGATAEVDGWQTLLGTIAVHPAITVGGTVTGTVGCTLGGNWKWTRSSSGWTVAKSGLCLICR